MNSSGFRLQPFDVIYVRTSVNYEAQRQVNIYGEVMQPGKYVIFNRQERIGDVIKRAGGLKPEAYMEGAQFRRQGQLIGNDLRNLIADPGVEENLLLQDGDTLFIPRRSEIISIQGAVLNPSSISYKAGYKFDDYISEAGGFTENARKSKAYVNYPNGRKDRTHRFLFFTSRPRIEPGSIVTIPFKPIDSNRLSPVERIGILSLLGTLAATATSIIINLRK